jgi:hypothetical protein
VPACVGAVYRPVPLIVPAVALPPTTPSTDHVTAVLPVPVTVAVNCVVPFAPTETDVWFNVTCTFEPLLLDEEPEPQPTIAMAVTIARIET